MKGQVLYVDETRGLILGEDSKRYKFDINEWKEKVRPKKGYQVDFEILNNEAIEIYLIDIPKSNFLEKNKIGEVKDEVLDKLNKIGNFKLAGIGSLLIVLSMIVFILIIKSGIMADVVYEGGDRFTAVFHDSYFYIPEIIVFIGVVLFSYSLKYISPIVYKKWILVSILIFIAIIGFALKNPFLGFISIFILFYSLYKLQEVFKVLSKEINIEKFKTIQKIFIGAFVFFIITFISILMKIKLSYFFSLMFFMLFGIGWLLSAFTFFFIEKNKNI